MILILNKIRALFLSISYRCKQYVAMHFVGKRGHENLICRQQIILSEPGAQDAGDGGDEGSLRGGGRAGAMA